MAGTEINPWASNISEPIAASIVIVKPRTSSSPWARTTGRITRAGTVLSVTKNDLIKNLAGAEPIAPNATDRQANLKSGTGVPPVNHAQDARATPELLSRVNIVGLLPLSFVARQ